jgi:hypothetical protein
LHIRNFTNGCLAKPWKLVEEDKLLYLGYQQLKAAFRDIGHFSGQSAFARLSRIHDLVGFGNWNCIRLIN